MLPLALPRHSHLLPCAAVFRFFGGGERYFAGRKQTLSAAARPAGQGVGCRDPRSRWGIRSAGCASLAVIEPPLALLGGEVRLGASGLGDPVSVIASPTLTGEAVRPPAPVTSRRSGPKPEIWRSVG